MHTFYLPVPMGYCVNDKRLCDTFYMSHGLAQAWTVSVNAQKNAFIQIKYLNYKHITIVEFYFYHHFYLQENKITPTNPTPA